MPIGIYKHKLHSKETREKLSQNNAKYWFGKKRPKVFYSWFKIKDYGSVENYKEFCKKKYNSAGWKVIFIDENEINVDNWKELCLNKIINRRYD